MLAKPTPRELVTGHRPEQLGGMFLRASAWSMFGTLAPRQCPVLSDLVPRESLLRQNWDLDSLGEHRLNRTVGRSTLYTCANMRKGDNQSSLRNCQTLSFLSQIHNPHMHYADKRVQLEL